MISKEFYEGLEAYIEGLSDKKNDKVILEYVMDELGCIPQEVQDFIAEKTGLFPFTIKGTIDFYPKFKEGLEKTGPKEIKVCQGMTCGPKGGVAILEKIKAILEIDVDETTLNGKFTLGVQRCFGQCDMGPNIYVDKTGYHKVDESDVLRILKEEGF